MDSARLPPSLKMCPFDGCAPKTGDFFDGNWDVRDVGWTVVLVGDFVGDVFPEFWMGGVSVRCLR